MNSVVQNQELMLKESIKHFLELHKNGSSDFSFFETIFFRLIQTMLDPPVEITWFYSAVTFHASKSSSQKKDLSTRVLIVKDLMNLHISCSNLSSTSKKIVLLAPVVYELYNILYDFGKNELSVKYEVSKLLENITNHIMLFAGIHDYGKGIVEFENMAVHFEDLVRVWTADRGGGSRSIGENLTLFFPVLSDCIWRGVNLRHGMQEFAGIVLIEVFLLKLCLNFGSGQSKEDFLKDTKIHTVRMIKALLNCFSVGLNLSERNTLLLEEIGSVVEKLACYFSICCSQYLYGENEGLNNFGEHFVDLLRVWTRDQTRGICDACDSATFFPILNNRFLKDVIEQPRYLAGAVTNETLLLSICLRIARGLNEEVSRRDMLSLAIQTIKGFQFFYFIDILFKTLLEPSLPVKTLLCSTDEILLRKVLYDAVVLIDYSFYFGRWSHSPDNQPKKVALLWLLVADKAIRFALSANDFAAVISYINAFGESQIVTEIIKWAKLQAGIEDPINRLHIQHPQVLIAWLLILEGNSIRIFDEESLVLANESMFVPRINFAPNFINLSSHVVDVNEGQEIGDTVVNNGLEIDAVFTSEDVDVNEGRGIGDDPWGNAHSFANVEAESSKKRKEAFFSDVNNPQPKHVKHGDSPRSFPAGDDFTCGTSDDDIAEARNQLQLLELWCLFYHVWFIKNLNFDVHQIPCHICVSVYCVLV